MDKEFIEQKAKKINISLSDTQIKKFEDYMLLLKEWNEKINLTSIIKDEDIVIKHFIDSLMIQKYIKGNESIIDVGTGAGFPGLPIKIINDNINLTLLDSLNKRIKFLECVSENLNLKKIKFVHGRTEEIAQMPEYREKYDIATARAVAKLNVLSEYCLPYVKINGLFICMKSIDIKDELEGAKNAIKVLGGKIECVDEFTLPDTDIKRSIIIIKKIEKCPKKYPRKPGKPSKEPIA